MASRDELLYLINGLLNNSYDIKTFCEQFTRIYDLETDYSKLSDDENREFADLCGMTGRFSDDIEELKIPNMYYCEMEIKIKAKYIIKINNNIYR